jgi:hypothetical protein
MKLVATDRESLRLLAHSYYFSCSLFAAVRVGLAEALGNDAKSAEALAAELKTEPDATARFLQFLTSMGILEEDEHRHFALSEVGEYLRPEHPNSIAREISMFSGGEIYRSWGEVLQTIRTGKPAFELLNGEPLFSYLAGHPEAANRFHQGWHEITATVAREVVEVYDLSSIGTVTDVGGGYGIFLGTLLHHVKRLKGVLFDLPFSVKGAEETFEKLEVADRVTVLTGDAAEQVPPMEICVMKSVIHGCSDEQAQRILSNCSLSLPARGKLLVLERVIPKGSSYHWSRLVDMTMMVMTGGRERTVEDYAALYGRSGLRLSDCLELPSGFSIIEGSKA